MTTAEIDAIAAEYRRLWVKRQATLARLDAVRFGADQPLPGTIKRLARLFDRAKDACIDYRDQYPDLAARFRFEQSR